MDNILELKNLTKTYPGVVALDDVSLDIRRGEIHALCGENGAGKSTLIKLVSGAITPDTGTISINGQAYGQMTPALSKKLGIEVIYQEFNLIPNLSVAENIFIGDYPGNKVTVDFARMEEKAKEVFRLMKVDLNPRSMVKDLTVAYMQLVEIAKALSKNVKILIMDEPTAPLTTNEVEILMDLVQHLKEQGVTIVYVSHRLNEIYDICDRLTVFRDGQMIETRETNDIRRKELVSLMVGREVSETYPERKASRGEIVLEVRGLSGAGARNISFQLHKGEILGLAGLVGAGRTETARMIFGADIADAGEIFLNGKKTEFRNPSDAVALGIGLVPEDRKEQGVILSKSIRENITLPIIKSIARGTVINRRKEDRILNVHKESLRIKTPSFRQKVGNLSGGNQQKVVLSKWLASGSRILIFDEPTRGIDVGAKQEIYTLMNELTEKGISIIMISSEMEEIMGMSDRILVLCEGRATGILERHEFSQEHIMGLASGGL
ncbi:sugar ABC transporter ATP-binding protein [Extibacter muris]|uniref:sugar ABC transporter ATP-binding protein n=1 Tax=Extibacter muris TaxID=1796622 RepID=UPI001D08482F|nr:sugar ABC transporter ATP-binding protein [Extibacter muris]MCB6203237.1 sugar ABC transporter ATP-binding protein [Extibacter muris]MCQ4664833.1 sugar ABC transporter ATP-binding protein [Extibacter muris]MCQ4694842.1 sugar ABC transporter ATP-binding protein [Extibacter muris]